MYFKYFNKAFFAAVLFAAGVLAPLTTAVAQPEKSRSQDLENIIKQLQAEVAELKGAREKDEGRQGLSGIATHALNMVAVPEGTFMMGSNSDAAYSDEKPVHEVTIPYRFAVGKYEVTFREWDACVADGGCSHRPSDEGWGRGSRPVIYVSWHDAKEYVKWLSRKTGEAYRLLSESEWEYVARAGTTTAYHFGSSISPGQANYLSNIGKTVAVGSYQPNAFGLHDVHGNVWEWVEDCCSR